MAIATIDPTTGRTVREFDAHDDARIERALAASDACFRRLRSTTHAERAGWLTSAARILRDEAHELGRIMTLEMGKTHASAVAEVQKCAWVCDFYAEHGEAFLADRAIETKASRSFVRYLPLGPVLAVMPWNFPLWQVFRFAAPAIAAGNVGLLKHASNVPRCALAIEDVLARAGVPGGGFATLLIGGAKVEAVLRDPRVRAATLTGSEPAGRSVGTVCGDEIKKVVLELGGSDPFIVMPSADMGHAVDMAVTGRTMNNGQSCIASKRFIVHEAVYDDFRERFAARLDASVVGDPMEASTDVGPLATRTIRDELARQVDDSIAAGARRVTGAERIDGPGWFYRPGLIEDVPREAPAFGEELFGPVGVLFRVDSLDAAIELANATRFGLGSAIFTGDEAEMERAFDEIEAGATFVNTITASDPRLPFGGVKASGLGRELAEEGIREFANAKTCGVGATS